MHEAEGERIFVLVRDANDKVIAPFSDSAKTNRLGAYPFCRERRLPRYHSRDDELATGKWMVAP